MTVIEARRGEVVLIAFPFVTRNEAERKRRPALVVQADRYNRHRAAVVVAAITSTRAHAELPCKVSVAKDSAAGRQAGLKLDSVIDCQTLATLPRTEIVRRLGILTSALMHQVDSALKDALGLA